MRRLVPRLIILCLSCVFFAAGASGSEVAGWRSEAADSLAVVGGTVVDSAGEPVPGATVNVRGDRRHSVMTDADGRFLIRGFRSKGDDITVEAVSIGYDAGSAGAKKGMTDCRIVLPPDKTLLDEVVVVGYATQKKVDLTGAVASVKTEALKNRPITNATNALAGLVPGLTVANSGGNTPGYEGQTLKIRGQGTLNNSAPLVVVDGMTGIALSDINPQDIASISVLKDAASSAIYGSRAANEVILVDEKRGRACAANHLQRQRLVRDRGQTSQSCHGLCGLHGDPEPGPDGQRSGATFFAG